MRQATRELLAEYGTYHRSAANRWCHELGIPLIVLSLLALARRIDMGAPPLPGSLGAVNVDAGLVLWLCTSLWYLRQDLALGGSLSLVHLGFWYLGGFLGVGPAALLFAVGWVFQLVGHSHFEKRSPAFTQNLTHLLVGPLWVWAFVLRRT